MTRPPVLLLACLLAPLVLGGCALFEGNKTSDQDLLALQVTYDQLQEMLTSEAKDTVLVDIRTEKQFAKAHIPAAINIPLVQIGRDDPRLGEATNVVVYGDGMRDFNNLAGVAAKKMLHLNYSNVRVYYGGLLEWQGKGSAVAGTQPATLPTGP